MFISQKRQRRLSGYGFINVGLPPASPSGSDDGEENTTIFLVAGYARYGCPYVWVSEYNYTCSGFDLDYALT